MNRVLTSITLKHTNELIGHRIGLMRVVRAFHGNGTSMEQIPRKSDEGLERNSIAQLESKVELDFVNQPLQNDTELQSGWGFPYSQTSFKWKQKPKNVLIVSKIGDRLIDEKALSIALWLITNHGVNVIVENHLKQKYEKLVLLYTFSRNELDLLAETVDLVVSLGGDGTMLHVSSLFNCGVPPVISFSMGTLGFLMPFDVKNYEPILNDVLNQGSRLLLRMRLSCTFKDDPKEEVHQVLNEAVLHRGDCPGMLGIDIFLNGKYLTNTLTDGLILATPTGSTGYSLSSGGTVVHPSINAILLTPICPRSLSFRPVILPPDAQIELRVAHGGTTLPHWTNSGEKTTLSQGEVGGTSYLDGRYGHRVLKNQSLKVQASPFPFPSVLWKMEMFIGPWISMNY